MQLLSRTYCSFNRLQIGKSMEPIPYSRPYIGKEEEDAVLAVLRSGWLTTGKETLAFEEDFSTFLKEGSYNPDESVYCMAVNSATSGLHLALESLGIKKGDIVLLPSMTFTASAEVVRYLGADIVFVDVSKGGYHMDPAALEETIIRVQGSGFRGQGLGVDPDHSGVVRAVMPVHYGGYPRDIDAVLAIAEKYRLKVVEDAAHSFPSFVSDDDDPSRGRWAGNMSDAGVFSFYATKTITTGEGGMVVTRDKALADRIRIMRSHGIDRSVWNRYTDSKASWYYEVLDPGFKYNIPDILSALGRVQLRRARELLAIRQELSFMYDEAFGQSEHFFIPPTGKGDARHLYPLRLNLENLSISRNEFAALLQEQGIGISVHFIPLHTMPYYKNRYSLKDSDFPETMKTFNRSISLPLWPGMTSAQIERVITVVKSLAYKYNKV